MIEPAGGPAYQQVASDLRRQIAEGELPVGSAIPSTSRLTELYGVSVTVVRAAVAQLRGDGLVMGHPGKGVFVAATPDALSERTATLAGLAAQLDGLRGDLGRVASSRVADADGLAALRAEVRALRAEVRAVRAEAGALRAEVAGLSARLGAWPGPPLPPDDGGRGRDPGEEQPRG